MKRATSYPNLLLLVLTAAVAACQLDVAAPGADSTPIGEPGPIGEAGTPITTFTSPPTGGCHAVRANTVLVDATHDGGVWWFPQSASQPSGFKPDSAHQGKALADYLRSRGFTVTELGRGGTMAGDSMLTYGTVIRAGYYYDAARPGYSAADLDAYAVYVACPRTLVLLGEFLRDGRRDVLADSLDIPFAGIEYGTISTLVAHELTAGVASLPWIAGSVLAHETNPNIQVLGRLANGKAAMGVLAAGATRIFFIGDVNGIQRVPQPFVANLVAWGFR